jgi:predicted CXXCH cytochrome family protein
MLKRIKKQAKLKISRKNKGTFFLVAVFLFAGSAVSHAGSPVGKAPVTSIKGAEYVGVETCKACHRKEARVYPASPHARIATSDEGQAQDCEICHGAGSIHVDDPRKKGSIINPRKDPEVCFSCHQEKRMEFKLPFKHPVMEGKMGCADCHEPHGADLVAGGAAMESMNGVCFKCHKDQQGPVVYEHAAMREGCTECHKVHGSIYQKMLRTQDANLCLRCHIQANFPTIAGGAHTSNSRIPQGVCFYGGCHTAVHGSNFDKTLRY